MATDLSLAGTLLEWRKILRLRGPMPCEIRLDERVLAHVTPVRIRPLSAVYDAAWGSIRWEMRRAGIFFPRHGSARLRRGGTRPLLTLRRTGFRNAALELPGGGGLQWMQAGITGTRYIFSWTHGTPCMQLRSTGGPLRWSGSIEVAPAAGRLEVLLPLLVSFSVFLVLNSSELHLV